MKDRLLLIGQNLVDLREKNKEEILEIKKEIEILKRSMERLIDFLERASNEFSKFAKKEDLEIFAKQIVKNINKNKEDLSRLIEGDNAEFIKYQTSIPLNATLCEFVTMVERVIDLLEKTEDEEKADVGDQKQTHIIDI